MKRFFIIFAVLFCCFSVYSAGVFAYSHVNGLALELSSGYSHKVFNYSSQNTKITAQGIPLNLQVSYFFPEKEKFGLIGGCEIRFPLSYYSTETKKTYSYIAKNILANPYLLFAMNFENYTNNFAFVCGLGVKLDQALYMFDMDKSKDRFTSLEIEGLLEFRLSIVERFRLVFGARGGYSFLNWHKGSFIKVGSSGEWTLTPFVGIGYDF